MITSDVKKVVQPKIFGREGKEEKDKKLARADRKTNEIYYDLFQFQICIPL